ncbi:MAG: 16S rRNA (guanine(966)-N(2))-methyltransferase RsmD [Bacteroidota bacterium]|nr:16S rRNA (guanine(966)-N(2))-methyltransferase RsmD [Bacteroidota bacterium]
MRVIGGALRGRIIKAPLCAEARPTTDRVKESMFDMIVHRISLEQAVVCDLFAGSGSLGIEALSRGAAHAVFVERDRRALGALRSNIEELGLRARADVVAAPVEKALGRIERAFDCVFADPPYRYAGYRRFLELLFARNLLMRGGLVCIEHDSRTTPVTDRRWRVVLSRRFGGTTVTILTQADLMEGHEQ